MDAADPDEPEELDPDDPDELEEEEVDDDEDDDAGVDAGFEPESDLALELLALDLLFEAARESVR